MKDMFTALVIWMGLLFYAICAIAAAALPLALLIALGMFIFSRC